MRFGYRRSLTRSLTSCAGPEFLRCQWLSDVAINSYIARLRVIADVVPGRVGLNAVSPDPDDDHVLACALEGGGLCVSGHPSRAATKGVGCVVTDYWPPIVKPQRIQDYNESKTKSKRTTKNARITKMWFQPEENRMNSRLNGRGIEAHRIHWPAAVFMFLIHSSALWPSDRDAILNRRRSAMKGSRRARKASRSAATALLPGTWLARSM